MDKPALVRYLRFALDELSTRNGQFEFEALCQETIRARVASNLVTATGPVAAKGDQGRDAETYVSYLQQELGPHSSFLALVREGMVAVCCTLQRDGLEAKFVADAEKVVASGAPVERIYALSSMPIAVGIRHQIEKAAGEASGVPVQVFDGVWIAEQLADEDLFWVAERFLQIDEAMRPPRQEPAAALEEWYLEARERWRDGAEPSPLTGDFYELRAALREAKEPGPARPDLPFWLDRMEALFAAATEDPDLTMRIRYELAVCTLIGKRDLRSADHHVEAFFPEVIGTDNPFRLQDAQTLLWFLFGMVGTGRSALVPDQIAAWGGSLREHLASLLEAGPQPTRAAYYRYLLGLQSVQIRPELIVVPGEERELPEIDVIRENADPSKLRAEHFVDAPGAIEAWLTLLRELPATALFPVERLAETVTLMSAALCDLEAWDELTELLDRKLAESAGRDAAAAAAFDRAIRLAAAERPLEAIAELHAAKVDWFGGKSIRKSLQAMLSLSSSYLELELPAAAKMYALAAAYAASAQDGDEAADVVPSALVAVARAEFFAGRWLAAMRAGAAAMARSLEHLPTPERLGPGDLDEDLLGLLSVFRLITAAARDLGAGYAAALDPIFLGEWADIRGETLAEEPALSAEQWRAKCEELGLTGPPFADATPLAPLRFAALGLEWTVVPADAAAVAPAERLAAAAAVLSAGLARHELCLLRGAVTVEVSGAERAAGTALTAEMLFASEEPEGGEWSVTLGTGEDWLNDPKELTNELVVVLMTILTERSLLPQDRMVEVASEAGEEGVLGSLFAGRAYDELAATMLDELPALTADLGPPWQSDPPTHPALAWRDGPGPGYDPAKAQIDLESRYRTLPPTVRATLPRLLADPGALAAIQALREDGWLDWQVLQALSSIVASHPAPEDVESWPPERIEKFLTAPEDPELEPIPLEAFAEENLRAAGNTGMIATLPVLGLEVHTSHPDFDAIRDLLIARFGYRSDDIEHPDPFTA